jgi:hypothetical protein
MVVVVMVKRHATATALAATAEEYVMWTLFMGTF